MVVVNGFGSWWWILGPGFDVLWWVMVVTVGLLSLQVMVVMVGNVQHSSGHFAGLCSSSEASWGVPKLIRLYNLLSQLVQQQRRGTILRGQTSSWNLLTLIIKSFSPLKQLHQGHRS
ncbi:uncharacterized protein LOC136064184 [Quercus suber]|uniref:uncharacterized protein LOC136064184 n=1 Tax=Quercus suber TaxID=58331 RepID=UPI0032DF1D11